MSDRLITIAGIALIIGIAIAFSNNRKRISFRIVSAALGLQLAIALFALYFPVGKLAIQKMSDAVLLVVGHANAGIQMVFGDLALPSSGFSFAINVLPIVIFFSALMSVLYHLGIMQLIVRIIGLGMQRLIGTRYIESMNAAANIFVGLTESPLAVRPYLGQLSDAQLFAIMVSGVASVSGTVLAAYSQLGVRLDYLLAASFMSAPGGLAMASLLMPEENPEKAADFKPPKVDTGHTRHANIITAAGEGTLVGLRVAATIAGMLIAFVSLIALGNTIVGGIGSLVGFESLTLHSIFGVVFAPLMYLLGAPWGEAQTVGMLFGEKLILNEFVAFIHLGEVIDTLSPRSEAIVTFSLCGFANLSSIAILLGGLGALVPEKRPLIGRFGLRAVLAGSLSNLMSAAFAALVLVF